MHESALTSRRSAILLGMATLPVTSSASGGKSPASLEAARAQVREAEQRFASSMAARDLVAFATFIAEDAVFIGGGSPLRGKAAVLEAWQGYFKAPEAPFSWQPEIVEVAASGTLGYSEGPVTSRDGSSTLRYFSTWQLQASGLWLVVFDNGYTVCKR